MRIIGLCGIALTLCIASLQAQLPTRDKLEEMVNPSLSVVANRAVRATTSSVDLGTIESGVEQRVCFRLKSYSKDVVVITQIRSTCSCLKVISKPQRVEPNAEFEIEAMLNSSGRSGTIKHNILIYTSLDAKYPTERLTVRGTMHNSDKFSHLKHTMGELRISRQSVVLDQIKVDTRRSERIAVANAGERDITLSVQQTIEGLEFRCEPQTLKPNEEGDIVISYTTKKPITEDITTMLFVEGCSGRATERVIKVTIKR